MDAGEFDDKTLQNFLKRYKGKKEKRIETARHTDTQSPNNGVKRRDVRIVKELNNMLNSIEVAERPVTARGRHSTLKTKHVAAKIPEDLFDSLEALPGRRSHHIEKALRLYIKVLEEQSD